MKGFNGQKVPGHLFNVEGEVTLPSFNRLSANSIVIPFEGIKREVDILGENADVKWVVEIKGRAFRALHTLDELVYLAEALKSKAWLVAFSDVSESARKAAHKRGVFLTGQKELIELKRLIETQNRV
jgi:hypothetical protein